MEMNRKEFLQTLGITGAAVAVNGICAVDLFAQDTNKDAKPDLVVVRNGEPDAMFQKAITALGGIGKFVKKGQKVVVKPNIGWDKPPEIPANTNPKLIGELVKQIVAAGAKDVVVFDTACDNPRNCYKHSGIEEAVAAAGGRMVFTDKKDRAYRKFYREVKLPQGKILKSAEIHEEILDSDVWFNVPVLKVHGGAKLTCAMKNLMGIVWNPGQFHRDGLQQCIADICTLPKKPVLNIIDAYRILKANGPQGRTVADGVLTKLQILSTDMVAADTYALEISKNETQLTLQAVGHISAGEELKLGTTEIRNKDKVNIIRISI
ncbi:MAG: DUF362 domain-containing protein [Planctomycetaceae bacterium]|jgi:uncharacterized protein (DUF362 family)|nr:DUF362 domain-containing protein [Planctomycetaceae bacterium]